MLVARDGNDPSFFGRKPNVLPLDERAKLRLSSSVLVFTSCCNNLVATLFSFLKGTTLLSLK